MVRMNKKTGFLERKRQSRKYYDTFNVHSVMKSTNSKLEYGLVRLANTMIFLPKEYIGRRVRLKVVGVDEEIERGLCLPGCEMRVV